MLLFELLIFKCMSLSHSMFCILLCSLERFMILLMMCFNRVFFPFKSMLKLVFTLVKRHHMVVVRWNVELFNESYFLFFMLLFRIWMVLHFNIKLIWTSISINCRFLIRFWCLMISLWSLMMVNMRLHMCDSMMNNMCFNFFFGRASMNILHRNRR